MAGFLEVHHLSEDPNTHEVRIVQTLPYLVLKGDGAATPLFLKQGRVCDRDGREIKKVPSWLWHEASKCSSKALEEVGFNQTECQNLAAPVDDPIQRVERLAGDAAAQRPRHIQPDRQSSRAQAPEPEPPVPTPSEPPEEPKPDVMEPPSDRPDTVLVRDDVPAEPIIPDRKPIVPWSERRSRRVKA